MTKVFAIAAVVAVVFVGGRLDDGMSSCLVQHSHDACFDALYR